MNCGKLIMIIKLLRENNELHNKPCLHGDSDPGKLDSNPDSDNISHVDCDPDSNPDSGPGASVNVPIA